VLQIFEKGNKIILKDDNFSDLNIVKSESLEFEILNRNCISVKFKKALLG
jgi:hypothetical protein